MTDLPYHDLFATRLFDPNEQAVLTRIDGTHKRVIRARIDIPFERADPVIIGRKRMMMWPDIVRWSIIGEVHAMGLGLKDAVFFASSAEFDRLIYQDVRRTAVEHIFVVCQLIRGGPKSRYDVTSFCANKQFYAGNGCCFFGIDYSDLQDRLLQRLDTLLDAPMKTKMRRLKTVKVIARELGVSDATVRRWAKAGILPVTKSGCGGRTSAYEIEPEAFARLKR